ncbi:PepSY domain-containing protein [Pseudidiomarina sp. 1APP75-32.1]|uniref:PepSY domain-containing protein n=1 Tax=Pseudidiomarina terrestris TaxID=2820060 RepID=A0AAW7QXF4_9GAMM|nr:MULTISPECIES: PepSY-associated TM helix domain-containing protein [unclassified Pseudidiomarina]MDN7124910.1 PepSY domain-containing protein [Pseudidiomarina sp. 1APP75-32.1]MDN7129617.1 PepSY domain-containing protein [Pseudidiomarina sp. 1APR75-15]
MRKTLHKWHGWIGIIILIPFLFVCLTGSILIFKKEIDGWLIPEVTGLSQTGGERLSLNTLTERVNAQLPDYEIGSWEIFPAGHDEADRVFVIKEGTDEWHKVHLDPYTGELLSQPTTPGHYLTDWLLELHYTLLLNDIEGLDEHLGLIITFILAVFLVFMGISGLIIYRRFWARVFTLRWNQRLLVVFSDLHKMFGTLASPILLILGITGGYYSAIIYWEEFKEHGDGAEHHIMSERLYADHLDIDSLVARSQDAIDDFKPTYLLFPFEPELPFTVFGRAPTANPLLSNYGSVVNFDPWTGAYQSTYNLNEQGVGMKTLDSFRRLHFGTFGGLPIKILWCVVGLTPLLLGITGTYLWWQRRNKSARKRRRR